MIRERAKEKYPKTRPRIISDNGAQFIARDFNWRGGEEPITNLSNAFQANLFSLAFLLLLPLSYSFLSLTRWHNLWNLDRQSELPLFRPQRRLAAARQAVPGKARDPWQPLRHPPSSFSFSRV